MNKKVYAFLYIFLGILVVAHSVLIKMSDYLDKKIEEYSMLERELIKMKNNIGHVLKVGKFSVKSYSQAKNDLLTIIDEMSQKFDVEIDREIRIEENYMKVVVNLSSDRMTKDKFDFLIKYVNSSSPVFIIKYFEINSTQSGYSFRGTVEIKDVFKKD